ncbi:MAG: MBL fold metallo-hydrolase [Clostridia bacterium]|nr:MBL fold metallo-hydrolase [Clostridia bacterium]
MAGRRKKDYVKIGGIAVFLMVAIVSYLYSSYPDLFGKGVAVGNVAPENAGVVDFIDCGQGDSALILSEGEVTLIDTSTGENTEQVLEHLESRGIEQIDHLVLTHPHEDHIGGAKAVLENVEVENIYMKRPTSGTEPTSAVYLNLLKEIQNQGKTVHNVQVGETFTCGKFTFTVLGPLEEYEDLNDQSVVLQGVYGDCSFLFTGDMEAGAEEDLVDRYGRSLQSTVLKVGHHGSSTSSSEAFLQAVDPQFAVISCGTDNRYGHPHEETVGLLTQMNVELFRTDTMGTVTVYTDGTSIDFEEAAA